MTLISSSTEKTNGRGFIIKTLYMIYPIYPKTKAEEAHMKQFEKSVWIWREGQADKLTQLLFCDRVAIRCYK